jgi:hypothetical protein
MSRRGEIEELVVPPGNHRDEDLRRIFFGPWQAELVLSLSKEHPATLGARNLPGCALIVKT